MQAADFFAYIGGVKNLNYLVVQLGFSLLTLSFLAPAHGQDRPAPEFLETLEGRYTQKFKDLGTKKPGVENLCEDFSLEIVESEFQFTSFDRENVIQKIFSVNISDPESRPPSAWANLGNDHQTVADVFVGEDEFKVVRRSEQPANAPGYARTKETFTVQKNADGSLRSVSLIRMDYRGASSRAGSWVPKMEYLKCVPH